MKICPVGAELFHVDGRTDRHDEANSRFSQFCESAKKSNNVVVAASGKNVIPRLVRVSESKHTDSRSLN